MHKDRTLLIFLHGSAGSGIEIKQFLSILPLSSTDPSQTFVNVCQKCQIDLVTPTAAERAYTPMFGQKMNVWYDRAADFTERGVDEDAAAEDIEGIDKSLDRLVQLLQNLVTDPTFSHVFIGGFSMGGGISLQVYSRISQFQKACNGKLRGLFSMGSFHPNSSRLLRVVAELRRRHEAEGNKGVPKDWVPVLMLHGDNDDFILPAWGKVSASSLVV
jgi:predicted esterase